MARVQTENSPPATRDNTVSQAQQVLQPARVRVQEFRSSGVQEIRRSGDNRTEKKMAAYSEVAKEDKEAGRPVKEPLVKEKEAEEGEEEEEEGPMSLLRKAAFISSILFSLLLCSVS